MREVLQQIHDSLTPAGLLVWSVVLTLLLAGILAVLALERRMFAARGKTGAWWFVRLSSLPILALVVMVVLLPARSVSGMEALGVFYIVLFTLAPLLWFGLHVLAGRLASPSLSRGESTWIACSGLAVLLVPPVLIGVLNIRFYTMSIWLGIPLRSEPNRVSFERPADMPVLRAPARDAGGGATEA